MTIAEFPDDTDPSQSRDPLWYKRAVFYEVLIRGQWWQLVGSPLTPGAESETFVCSPAPPGEGVAQAG